jgi:hypothetical protein
MPANKGAESKQGLIVTLVCFILLSIILGVTTYYGYAGQDALVKAAKDADTKEKAMQKSREWYKYVALKLKYYAGEMRKDDNQALADAEATAKNNTADDKAAYDSLFQELDRRLVKDPKRDRTFESYREKVNRLEQELANTRASLLAEQTNLAKERAANQRNIDTKDAEIKEAHDKLKKAEADNVAERDKLEKEMIARLTELNGIGEELDKVKKDSATQVGTLQKKESMLKQDVKDQQEAYQKLQRQLTPPDLQKFSTPKGKILSVDPAAQLAWINLGSADHVRAQQGLTFSIFGNSSAGPGSMVLKGALEVVNVIGPHLSQAKITQTPDPRVNPIQRGDVLVNPAWSPTMQTHVAIAGLIDFTGQGRDQIDELLRTLNKQNVVVDAYLDLKEATIKGKMSVKTDYLILGEQPQFDANVPIREGDARFERKTDLLTKISDMQQEANRYGVTVVPLRRFVALTGYQVPPGASASSGYNYESRVPRASANGEAKAAGKKEAAKEENKQ